jgi:peptidoglycan/LPS O-acetylase OafA/YrhL
MKIYAPTEPIPQQGHRSDIDGLRAVAVLAVLAFHAGVPHVRGGFVGVDVFFVISGYLICSIVSRELEQGRFSIGSFYMRRAKRIVPALVMVLAVTMLLALALLSPYETTQLAANVIAAILSFSNIRLLLVGNYFDPTGMLNPLLMTWSLAVEEQFYLVFPLLMLLLYHRNRRHLFATLAVGCAASLLLCIDLEFRHPSLDFYLPFTRAWEIGFGTLLALWQRRPHRLRPVPFWGAHLFSLAGLLAILGSVLLYSPSRRFPGYEAIPPVLGTVLLLHFERGIANRILSMRGLRAIGLISYSLYLWHWPLLSLASIVDGGKTPPAMRALLLLLAAGAATLSFFFIERPFRATRASKPSRVLLAYGCVIAATVLAASTLLLTRGVSRRTPQLAQIETAAAVNRSHVCINYPDNGPDLSSYCVPPPAGTPAVALLGDSHAEAVESTLRGLVDASHQQLVVLAAYACPPFQGVTRLLPGSPGHAENCAAFNQQALSLVASRPDIRTVVLCGSWGMLPTDAFPITAAADDISALSPEQNKINVIRGLGAEVHALESAGKRVLLIDDWPDLTIDPLERARYAALPARRILAGWLLGHPVEDTRSDNLPAAQVLSPAAKAVRSELLRMAATDPNLTVVDTKRILCNQQYCRFAQDGTPLYSDTDHISRSGAEQILHGVTLSAPGSLQD